MTCSLAEIHVALFLGIEKLKVCKITRNCAAAWYQFMNEYKEALSGICLAYC